MSPRAAQTLADAHIIACEDTRRTRKVLSHLGISARELVVYNDTTERRRAPELAEAVARGRDVVLVSDAGMPGLSDPGYHLVRLCAERSLPIEVVPGPNAALSALAISGLAPGRFVFEGFLPRRSGERKRHLVDLLEEKRTLVFYESPHRLAPSLQDMAEVLGEERPAAVARELTKMHEEVKRGTLTELAAWASKAPPRGEMVVVVSGAVGVARPEVSDEDLALAAKDLMDSGVPRSEALSEVAREMGVPRRKVFDALLDN
jgi:16S rRNA (cytidine1402-2'-O)-methyltransferase